MIACWPCPAPGGPSEEYALTFDQGHRARVLIVPALFDEANRLRRFTVTLMRRLAAAGVGSVLPDLPGTNESLQSLRDQSLASWRAAVVAANSHFGTSHVLAIRGGALLVPQSAPGWDYAPSDGSALLRTLLRSRTLGAREAGREETLDGLLRQGQHDGLELAGYPLGPALLAELLTARTQAGRAVISQSDIGGSALWRRAEPDEDPAQSEALATRIAHAVCP